MTWVKLDDQFADHPKLREAGPLAGWLYVSALCYANRYLTDGLIKESVLPGLIDLGGVFPRESRNRLGERLGELVWALLNVDLWEPAEDGYQIHDFHKYNPSARKVQEKRQRAAEKLRDWRANKPDVTSYKPVSNRDETAK